MKTTQPNPDHEALDFVNAELQEEFMTVFSSLDDAIVLD